ncbi:hypothetical protein K501DRAFT_276722 [Backusella circina FSU 941]|nr:hypothetical protein K501DRAFT_276722 [Backusella circina FSU 941]
MTRPGPREPSLDELIEDINSDIITLTSSDEKDILRGDVNAIYKVAKQYLNAGLYEHAGKWFTKSALADHPESQIQLGHMYFHGQGVPVDFVDAYHWYITQSENPLVQYYLGELHEQGDAAMYLHKARVWYECSAEAGIVEAQYKAGTMYAHLMFDPQNIPKALRYLQMAASAGHERAIKAMEAMVMLLGQEEVEFHQSQNIRPDIKKPKVTVSDEYLRQLQVKAVALRSKMEQAQPAVGESSIELKNQQQEERLKQLQEQQQKQLQKELQKQLQKQRQEQRQEVEWDIMEGEIEDLSSYLADFTEEEKSDYYYLMSEKVKQDMLIKELQAEVKDFEDYAFELVDRQRENERIRQRNRKMEELFIEMGITLPQKRVLTDDNVDDDRPAKKTYH